MTSLEVFLKYFAGLFSLTEAQLCNSDSDCLVFL